MLTEYNKIISYVNWSQEPLSSDVIFVKGRDNTWIFDVGHSDEALEEIDKVEGHKNIVLSHFHADHIGNVKRLFEEDRDDITLFVSKQTYKYTKRGEIVDTMLEFDDGINIKIFPIPSSHAKGCIAMEVNDEFLFLGDAIYPTYKDDKKEYNAQLLKAQIELLKTITVDKVFLSHDVKAFVNYPAIVAFLESIYLKRRPNS